TKTSEFDKKVKRAFQAAACGSYIKALRMYLIKLRKDLPEKVRGKIDGAFGVANSSVGRHNKLSRYIPILRDPIDKRRKPPPEKRAQREAVVPSLASFLTPLASLGLDVENVGFPKGKQLKLESLLASLVCIRNEILGREPAIPPKNSHYSLGEYE